MDLVVHEGIKVFLIGYIDNLHFLLIFFCHFCLFVVEEDVDSHTGYCTKDCSDNCNNDPGDYLKASYFGVISIGK